MSISRTPTGYAEANKYEWNSWRAAKSRCYQKKYHKFHLYGGRGIKVCDRWLGANGFVNFMADMGSKPTRKHSLDRIDGDGNYEPSNCRWATQKEQTSHTSRSRRFVVNGVVGTLEELAAKHKISKGTAMSRIRSGWSEERAFTVPTTGIGANQTTYKEVCDD